jgi:hypothetical protein
LSILINGIQNGSDKIGEMNMLGTNMVKSAILYVLIAGAFTIGFSLISIGLIKGLQ